MREFSCAVDYASCLYDELDMGGVAQATDVGHDVAIDQHEIGGFARFQTAEQVEFAKQLGAVARARAQRIQRVDAELDHERQLAGVLAMAVEWRACVCPEHESHPSVIRAAEARV